MNALVIGHGRMGRFHALALTDLGYRVTTVDPHAPADLTHLPGLEPYTVAAVATPVEHIAEYTLPLAHAGLLVLAEKPFAPTLEAAESLARSVEGHSVCVGFIERYNPQVQRVRRQLPLIGTPTVARFTRHNDRPSPDLATDLRIHDVDLTHYLGLTCPTFYDVRASAPIRARQITVNGTDGRVVANLMAHTSSPLHALWQAFLAGDDYPTPEDAVRAHRALAADQQALAA